MVFATTIFLCGVAPLFLPHTSAFITRSHAIYSTPRGQPCDAPVPRSRAEQQQKGSMCIYNNYQRDLAQPALSLAKFKRAMQLRGIHRATSSTSTSTSTWITRNARLAHSVWNVCHMSLLCAGRGAGAVGPRGRRHCQWRLDSLFNYALNGKRYLSLGSC